MLQSVAIAVDPTPPLLPVLPSLSGLHLHPVLARPHPSLDAARSIAQPPSFVIPNLQLPPLFWQRQVVLAVVTATLCLQRQMCIFGCQHFVTAWSRVAAAIASEFTPPLKKKKWGGGCLQVTVISASVSQDLMIEIRWGKLILNKSGPEKRLTATHGGRRSPVMKLD